MFILKAVHTFYHFGTKALTPCPRLGMIFLKSVLYGVAGVFVGLVVSRSIQAGAIAWDTIAFCIALIFMTWLIRQGLRLYKS